MNVMAKIPAPNGTAPDISKRIDGYDWQALADELDAHGNAVIERLLSPEECGGLAALYPHEEHFRSHVVMARHGFGKGEYRYFSYPLPGLIGELRTTLYARLAPVANRWNERMSDKTRYPENHQDYLRICHEAGQQRPTPLLLQYGPGDFNALH